MAHAAHLICDGELEIVKITEDLYDQAWQLFRNYFLKYENLSIIFNLLGSQQNIDNMEAFFCGMLQDNISFAARHCKTKELASICVNKILLFRNYFLKYENLSIIFNLLGSQQNIDNMEAFFCGMLQDNISFAARHCKTKELASICVNKILNPSTDYNLVDDDKSDESSEMAAISEFLDRMENTHNLFEEWNIDCIMEIFFLSTNPKFAKRGLATTLSAHSIEYAQKMLHGALPDSEQLPAHVRNQKPKAVCSVFTSLYTQKVGEKLGLQVVTKVPFKELSYKGKPFSESIDSKHEYAVFAAKRL